MDHLPQRKSGAFVKMQICSQSQDLLVGCQFVSAGSLRDSSASAARIRLINNGGIILVLSVKLKNTALG